MVEKEEHRGKAKKKKSKGSVRARHTKNFYKTYDALVDHPSALEEVWKRLRAELRETGILAWEAVASDLHPLLVDSNITPAWTTVPNLQSVLKKAYRELMQALLEEMSAFPQERQQIIALVEERCAYELPAKVVRPILRRANLDVMSDALRTLFVQALHSESLT